MRSVMLVSLVTLGVLSYSNLAFSKYYYRFSCFEQGKAKNSRIVVGGTLSIMEVDLYSSTAKYWDEVVSSLVINVGGKTKKLISFRNAVVTTSYIDELEIFARNPDDGTVAVSITTKDDDGLRGTMDINVSTRDKGRLFKQNIPVRCFVR